MKVVIFFIILTLIINCKERSREEVLKEEWKLSQNALVNTEIKNLHESIKTAKDDFQRAEIHTKIATIQTEKGNVVDSIKSANEAVKFQPNQYMSHYLLGKSYIQAARYDEAIKELLISIDLKGDFALSHFELGNAYYKKFKYSDSIKEYLQAVKIDPKLYEAYNNLGILYNLTNKFNEAEKSFNEVVRLKPKFSKVYKNLGILYETKLLKKPLAVVNYKKYLELRPNAPDRNLVLTWIQLIGGVK